MDWREDHRRVSNGEQFMMVVAAAAIRERIRDVKADQKSRNRYLGGTVPFGWTLDEEGELVACQSQQAAITRMVALRQAGQSLRAIADTMKADGVNVSHAGVKKIVEAELARG
jgi:hypothetical protein